MLMIDKNNSTFDLAAFLAHAGLDRRIVDVKRNQTFLPREIRQTPSFIFRAAVQNLPSFRTTAKRLRSRFSPPGTSLERGPSRRCLGCACPRPLR
jgi:hypothetical protein